MFHPLKHFVVVCVWIELLVLTEATAIRNPPDINDIIALDHDYLTYHPYHISDDVTSAAQYHFRLEKGKEYVPLRLNNHIDLNVPMCFLKKGKIVCELGTEKDVNFYHDESRSVAVAISNENGTLKMKGIVNTENHTIHLDPLESPDLPSNRYHVIKKRWTGNMIYSKTPSPYKNLPTIPKPKGSSYCIDILCVVDYSIYRKFLQSEKKPEAAMKKIRYYYAHVINGVNMRYASLTTRKFEINVRLAGYFIAKSARDLPFIDAKKMQRDTSYRVDSNFTLTSLDAFLKKLQEKQNKRRRGASTLPDFNHATLFLEYASTNLGGSVLDSLLDSNLEKPPNSEVFMHGPPKDGVSGDKGGTSFVSGICSRSKSTSLVVDHGAYTSAGVACHELGHNLGVFFHDGEGTARSATCNASFNYIMAPASYLIDKSNLKYSFTFSPCSVKQIKDNLKQLLKMNRNCLQCSARDRNSVADVQTDRQYQLNLQTLPGQTENVHQQCQQLYGKGSFMCPPKSPEEMCYRMYCYDPSRGACAIISEQMAAPGTPCGKHKICHMGKCIKDTNRGVDMPDDCPYPDIPSKGAYCEDATPYLCKKPKFRQKCCQSCNHKFTPEEACKDSHVRINSMFCFQLMTTPIAQPGCARDYDIQNLCCRSCKRFSGVMVQIGIGTVRRGTSNASRNPRQPTRQNNRQSNSNKYLANKTAVSSSKKIPKETSSSKTSKKKPTNSSGGSNSSNGIPIVQITGPCQDNPYMQVNKKSCTELIKEQCYYCSQSAVREACCASCRPYTEGKKECPVPMRPRGK